MRFSMGLDIGSASVGHRYAPLVTSFDFTSALDARITASGGANRTRLNSSGVRVAGTAPRFDHDAYGTSRGIYIEGARTNLWNQSANFADAAWLKIGAGTPTITSDATTGPDGVVTYTDQFDKTTTAAAYILKNLTKAASALPYAASISVKKSIGDYFPMRFQGNGGTNKTDAIVNIAAGTWNSDPTAAGAFASAGGELGLDGNGFHRLELRATSDTHTTLSTMLSFNSQAVVVDQTDTTDTTAGFICYPQLEQAAFASSPMVPNTTTVTTTADDLAITGTNFSDWYADTRYIVATADSVAIGTRPIWEISLTSDAANNRITLWLNGQYPTLTVVRSGVTEASIAWPYPVASNEPFTIAVRLVDNDIALSVDGEAEMTDTSCTLPSVDRMFLGKDQAGNYLFGHIARIDTYAS